MSKVFSTAILIIITISFTNLWAQNKPNNEVWNYVATATGKTTGHIGDLIITNTSNKTQTISLGSYLIPPKNGKQGFAIYKEAIEKISVKAGGQYVHELNGYCVSVDLPPPDKGDTFPHYLNWRSSKNSDTDFAKLWHNRSATPMRLNLTTQITQSAQVILIAVQNLEDQFHNWKGSLEIPDIYPEGKTLKEAMIQQAIWQFTSALQNKNYSFNNFEQGILNQQLIRIYMNSKEGESTTVQGESIKYNTYFNYQCQKLWHIINELNSYTNPRSRELLTNREINTKKLDSKYIEFQDIWESVALTGIYFKAGKNPESEPLLLEEKDQKKKILPYVAGGAGTVGIIATVIALTNKKPGCTDSSACNFDEKAEKDDGSCEYEDCASKCDLNEGTVQFCAVNDKETIALFEANGIIYQPVFDTVMNKLNCKNANTVFYEGQKVKFDFYEMDSISICEDSIKQIMLTCLETEEKDSCDFKDGTIEYDSCMDDGEVKLKVLIRLESQRVINPWNYGCSEFFNDDGSRIYVPGTPVKVDFEESTLKNSCNPDQNSVIVTCFELNSPKTYTSPEPNLNSNTFNPFFENRLITTPIQSSEFPETTIITNILGVNYYQPVTATIFIENQTAVGYMQESDLYFLNNKMTVNAKNPNLPVHYGLGFNSMQLTEMPNLMDWQSELIWNIGMKVPVFKIFQFEAEVFKSFGLEDDPNFSLRLIYRSEKSD